MDKQFIGLTVSLLILLPFATALRQTIQLDTINSWQYLCRFIFSDTPQKVFTKVPASIFDNATSYVDVSPYLNKYGLLKFSATFTAEIRPTLLLYRKYEDWRRVYTDDSEDCVSIASHADAVIQLRQKVSPLQNGGGYYLYNLPVVREDGSFAVNGVMAFPLLSDRDWTHIAVANCDVARGSCPAGDFCQGPLIINLKLHLTNGKNNELSRDERYIFAAAIALFIFQLIVAVWALFVRAALLSVQKYHHTARIILGSIFVHLSSLLLSIVYWSTYNATGRPILLLKFLGYLFMDIANILTIIEIILVAKGWTIVRKHLSNTGITRIGVYGVFLLVVTIFAEIFRVYLYDAAVSVSVYTSPPGIFLLLLRCGFAGSWFFYASFTTVRNYARKHKFYKKFIVCFGAWLEAPILFVLISFGVSRVKLTIFEYMWEWLLAVTPHVVFLILYDPNSRFNKSFPFHATTEFIGTAVPEDRVLVPNKPLDNAQLRDAIFAGGGGDGGGGDDERVRDSTASIPKDASNDFSTSLPGRPRSKGLGLWHRPVVVSVSAVKDNSHGNSNNGNTNTNTEVKVVRNITRIGDLYSEIRSYGEEISRALNGIVPMARGFSRVLEDWDGGEDCRDSDYDYDDDDSAGDGDE